MRLLVKLVLVGAVVGVLAAGMLPPLLARGALDSDALNAARAASLVFTSSGGGSQAEAMAIAAKSIAGDQGVRLVSVKVSPAGQLQTVQVTLRETVHTFMSGLPHLKGWFEISSTQQSSFGT